MKSSEVLDAQTEITFGLVGDRLLIERVQQAIGVSATRAFEKGEHYIGRQRVDGQVVEVQRIRPRGVWQFSTRTLIASDRILDHAKYLLEQLERKSSEIACLKESQNLFSRISICHVGSISFELPSDMTTRLAALCDEVAISCWEVDEEKNKSDSIETAGQVT